MSSSLGRAERAPLHYGDLEGDHEEDSQERALQASGLGDGPKAEAEGDARSSLHLSNVPHEEGGAPQGKVCVRE